MGSQSTNFCGPLSCVYAEPQPTPTKPKPQPKPKTGLKVRIVDTKRSAHGARREHFPPRSVALTTGLSHMSALVLW